jgi:CHASE2 domain-containing sensor protein
VALQGAIQRRFLVVAVEGLGEEYGAADESDWSGLVPAGLTKDRVVIVGTSETLEVQFVAVANEPARRIVRDSLAAVGVDARVMVQPDWFS